MGLYSVAVVQRAPNSCTCRRCSRRRTGARVFRSAKTRRDSTRRSGGGRPRSQWKRNARAAGQHGRATRNPSHPCFRAWERRVRQLRLRRPAEERIAGAVCRSTAAGRDAFAGIISHPDTQAAAILARAAVRACEHPGRRLMPVRPGVQGSPAQVDYPDLSTMQLVERRAL